MSYVSVVYDMAPSKSGSLELQAFPGQSSAKGQSVWVTVCRIFRVRSMQLCDPVVFCSFGKILVLVTLVVLLLFDFIFWLRPRQICWI